VQLLALMLSKREALYLKGFCLTISAADYGSFGESEAFA